MTKKHEGKSLHRLGTNQMERAFHDAWLTQNEPEAVGVPGGCLLEYLLGDNNNRGKVSDRDALVAATAIQWLGSPVGQRFNENVLAEQGKAIIDMSRLTFEDCRRFGIDVDAVRRAAKAA